jgi:hypothetical protein
MVDESNPPKRLDPGKLVPPKPTPTPGSSTEPEPLEVAQPSTPASLPGDTEKATNTNPLDVYSMRGMFGELEAEMVKAEPLLGSFILKGQMTIIYAEPNTGKTLLMMACGLEAIRSDLIDPANFYYINADDNSEGAFVKGRLLDDVGAHMLLPGRRGFEAGKLVEKMKQAVAEGTARGTCLIIDTAKKFVNLMDKKDSSFFAQFCRAYVMAGGTVVLIAHTTKTPNADGSPRYQGTTDFREDCDAVYFAQPLVPKAGGNERLIKLTRNKSRGPNPDEVAYVFCSDPDISYEEKVASVRSIDPEDLDDYVAEKEKVNDPNVMDAIAKLIAGGCSEGKMNLAKAAAEKSGVSHAAAIGVLERYTGSVRNVHLWDYTTGRHGRRTYRLIDQTKP